MAVPNPPSVVVSIAGSTIRVDTAESGDEGMVVAAADATLGRIRATKRVEHDAA